MTIAGRLTRSQDIRFTVGRLSSFGTSIRRCLKSARAPFHSSFCTLELHEQRKSALLWYHLMARDRRWTKNTRVVSESPLTCISKMWGQQRKADHLRMTVICQVRIAWAVKQLKFQERIIGHPNLPRVL